MHTLRLQDWRGQQQRKRPRGASHAAPSLGRPGVVKDERRTVYVGNLPYAATEEDIAGFFAQCGRIVDVRRGATPDGGCPVCPYTLSVANMRCPCTAQPQRIVRQEVANADILLPASLRAAMHWLALRVLCVRMPVTAAEAAERGCLRACAGKLHGYGFVQLESEEAAQAACQLSGSELMGRELTVDASTAAKPGGKGQPAGQPVEGCWFCLSNPNADVNLVASIGEPGPTSCTRCLTQDPADILWPAQVILLEQLQYTLMDTGHRTQQW
jgi:RNA recognition motif-containing protein